VNELHELRLRLQDWSAKRRELAAQKQAIEIGLVTAGKLVMEYTELMMSALRHQMVSRGFVLNKSMETWDRESSGERVRDQLDIMFEWIERHPS